MPEIVSETIAQMDKSMEDADQTLLIRLQKYCVDARPRLLQLARLCGVPEHSLEDIVQETLLAAWLHLDQLRAPEHLQVWLEGICRNQCRMFLRRRQDLPLLMDEPLQSDPFADVERRELLALLDQAMKRLSREAREILLLCDLAEASQQEAAQRLGLSVQTLRVKLHRARQQLRRVLQGQMRAEVNAYGLALDLDPVQEWRETAIWCRVCGRQRLRGIIEEAEHSGPQLRLRCPNCSAPDEPDLVRFAPLPALKHLFAGRRSLGPALKHLHRHMNDHLNPFLLLALTTDVQRCQHCQQPVRASMLGLDPPLRAHIQVALTCAACGCHYSIWAGELACSASTNPIIKQFLTESQRWIAEPDQLVTGADGPACCFRLTEVEQGTRLTVLAHPETLHINTAFLEESGEF